MSLRDTLEEASQHVREYEAWLTRCRERGAQRTYEERGWLKEVLEKNEEDIRDMPEWLRAYAGLRPREPESPAYRPAPEDIGRQFRRV